MRQLHPDQLTPERLAGAIDTLLARPHRPTVPVQLDGLARLTDALAETLAEAREPRRALPVAAAGCW